MARPPTRVHPGTIVAATWLIGIGLVFLLQQAWGLDWSDAWPLFVILLGVAGLVSRVAWGPPRLGPWSLTWPLLVTALGVVFLLATTGVLGVELGDLIARGWPLALVVIGAWLLLGAVWPGMHRTSEELRLPLAGASAADVRVRFGAGNLRIGAAAPGMLADGEYVGGVVHRLRGPGGLDLEQESPGWGWYDREQSWRAGLTTEVPLDLRLEFGAARAEIDLGPHKLRSLRIQTGASDTTVRLPEAAGETRVTAEAGAAQLTFEVPPGVAAQIRSLMVIGASQIDERRFPRQGDRWASADYATAANRIDLQIQGGVGAVRVR